MSLSEFAFKDIFYVTGQVVILLRNKVYGHFQLI